MDVRACRAEKGAPAILVAEDDVFVRLALADRLSDYGFTVFEAGSAAEAIRKLEDEPGIAIVLSEIKSPGRMSGFDLARWVREHRPDVMVVLTSSDGVRSGPQPAAEQAIIRKPYDVGSVVTELARIAQAAAI